MVMEFRSYMDWFQPFSGVTHSSGGIYITIQNTSRSERNLKKNIIYVGLLPGPKEPKKEDINNYLRPLVDELIDLYKSIETSVLINGRLERRILRAALTMVAYDFPEVKKLCGFTGFNSNCAYHYCQNRLGSLPENRYHRNFTNFDITNWIPRTEESHGQHADV